ncbi:SapC family protein [Sphingomonas sp. 2R-10]|uniref:SapC family protein n=1 Tax=Sphingomonas sp. 2R-10 TaxID=3045148 RepID=UPI0024BB64B4|nr:SapC family protein [Sphingomonas sp. 2R-10]
MPLNNVDHHDLTVAVAHGAAHGDAVNQVLLFPNEFETAQRDYPILFRRDERGGFYAVALLGLDPDDNLFLGPDGWRASYIPAVRQRGPFSPAPDGQGVQVDLDDPRVGQAGESLYLQHGGTAPYLAHIEAVLDVIREGQAINAPLFAAWEAARLLRPTTIEIDLGDGQTCAVEGIFVIDEDRLDTLDADALATLHRSGALRAAFMAVASLDNMPRLIDRRRQRHGG